jgi:hypothetical protein
VQRPSPGEHGDHKQLSTAVPGSIPWVPRVALTSRNVPLLSRAIDSDPRVSSRRATVIIEEPAKPLPTANLTAALDRRRAGDEFVVEPLVIPFTVVVLDELRNGPAEMTFADRNHSAETLFLDRAHEALRVGIRVGRMKRGLHHADPGVAQAFANGRTPLRVSITDQHAMADQHAIIRCGERAVSVRSTWRMNPSLGCDVEPTMCTRREARSMTKTV